MTALLPEPDELAVYLADNYGRCELEPCLCRKAVNDGKHEWLGCVCGHWKPTKARNWNELKAAQDAVR